MTDMDGNRNLDANQGEGQTHSDGSADADLLSTLNAINARLANLEGQQRALQSGKDRGIAGLQDQVHRMKSDFAEILEYGKRYADPTEAERNYKIDQFLSQTQAGASQNQGEQFSQGQATQGANNASIDPSILQSYGIDPRSPEYIAELQAGKSSFEATLAVMAKRAGAGAQEGVASGASGGAGAGMPQSNQERNQTAIKAQYDAEVDKMAEANGGYLSPRQLYFIQEKYINQHGLNPDTLGW